MTPLEILQLPIFDDNYVYLIRDTRNQITAVIDPGLAAPVLEVLKENKWELHYILNTHHHFDHVGGNLELKEKTSCKIYGPPNESIPGRDKILEAGAAFQFGEHQIQVLSVPGHTSFHIAYWIPSMDALFCGDTLFSLGCGRLFEGTPEEMWESLQKIKSLPTKTRIFCAHEYTEANARFALTIDAKNNDLLSYYEVVKSFRQSGRPTIPSLLSDELNCNPFLRPNSHAIRQYLNMTSHSDLEVFTQIRRLKDNF